MSCKIRYLASRLAKKVFLEGGAESRTSMIHPSNPPRSSTVSIVLKQHTPEHAILTIHELSSTQNIHQLTDSTSKPKNNNCKT